MRQHARTYMVHLLCCLLLAVQSAGAEPFLQHLDYGYIKQSRQPIQLKVSYFIDSTTSYNYWNIPQEKFRETSACFNPGFHSGILWLDIQFEAPPAGRGNYTLDFGAEGIEVAEAFIRKNGEWEFYGRTSRILPQEQVSSSSMRQKIPVNLVEFTDGSTHHIRIKVLSHFGSSLSLHLTPARTAEQHTLALSILHAMFTILVMTTAALLFLFGLELKDSALLLLGTGSIVFSLFVAQVTGVGPVFAWNPLSVRTTSPQCITYILVYTLIVLFTGFFFRLKQLRHIHYRFPVDSIALNTVLVFTATGLLLLLADETPELSARMFSATIIVSSLTFAAITAVRFFRKSSPLPPSICWWTPTFVVIAALQGLRILKTGGIIPASLFYDNYQLSYYLFFLLIMMPPLIGAIRKQSRKIKTLQEGIRVAQAQVSGLRRDNKFLNAAVQELLDMSSVIQHAIRLPLFNIAGRDAEESRQLIETSASCSVDLLQLLNLQQRGIEPETGAIQLKDFLSSCIAPAAQFARQKGISIQQKPAFPEDTVVTFSPNILELLVVNLLISIIKASPAGSLLNCELLLEADFLHFRIRSHTSGRNMQQDGESMERTFSLDLVEKLCSLYKGSFVVVPHTKGYEFSARIQCPAVPPDESSGRRYTRSCYAHPGMQDSGAKQKNGGAEQKAPALAATVLIAGNKENNNIFLRELLQEQCTVTSVTDGVDAWRLLNSKEAPLPDIVIAEQSLDLISGMELYRRCRNTPALQDIPFIMLLEPSERQKKTELMQQGIAWCLTKPFSAEDLLNAVFSVLSVTERAKHAVISHLNTAFSSGTQEVLEEKGGLPSAEDAGSMFSTENPEAKLSHREEQIALLISEGRSDKEIAELLHISPATVSTHNKRLFKKLGVHSRVELMGKVR